MQQSIDYINDDARLIHNTPTRTKYFSALSLNAVQLHKYTQSNI